MTYYHFLAQFLLSQSVFFYIIIQSFTCCLSIHLLAFQHSFFRGIIRPSCITFLIFKKFSRKNVYAFTLNAQSIDFSLLSNNKQTFFITLLLLYRPGPPHLPVDGRVHGQGAGGVHDGDPAQPARADRRLQRRRRRRQRADR